MRLQSYCRNPDTNRSRRRAISLLLCLITAATTTFTGCRPPSKTDAKETPPERPTLVEVEPLTRGAIEEIFKRPIPLEAEEEVKVFSRASNLVEELLAEEGDTVKAGQLLVRLEDDLQKIQLAKTENQVAKAQQEFERQQSLHEQNLISDQVFNDAKFELRQLELARDDAQRQLEYTEVRAPISGMVTLRNVNLGDHITVNQHLFNVVDFDSIVARIYLPESNLSELKLNQPARVTAPALGNKSFLGHVERISPIVDPKTGTIKVTIGFDQVDQLRPGLFVNVELVLAQLQDALLIPKRALIYDTSGEQIFVFRLGEDKRVERVAVVPKLIDRENVHPAGGFKEGDQVVVAGQSSLKDNALIRLPSDPEPEPIEEDDGEGKR